MTTILGISGSLRKGSFNTSLLRAAAALAPPGATIETASLHGIPLYDGDLEAESGIPAAVQALKARILAADGLLLVTPEYDSAYSARLGRPFRQQTEGGSPVREIRSPGSVRGAARKGRPYRDRLPLRAAVVPRGAAARAFATPTLARARKKKRTAKKPDDTSPFVASGEGRRPSAVAATATAPCGAARGRASGTAS